MPFGEGYRPKLPEEISKQLETAQDAFGQDAERSLVPESQDKEKILKMSEVELKEKFTRRYEMYLQLLRDQKRQEKTGESNLSPEDTEEMKKWLSVLNSLDGYIKKHHEGEEVTLRGKQIDVFDSLRNFLEEGGSEGYVKLPTGVGKTVLFTELIEAMDVKTLIVVPTKILVDQTAEKLEEFAPDLDFGKVYSYAKEHGRQVTIITYSSLVSQLENGQIKPEDFDCLILDEVHESLSDKRQEAVGKFDKAIKLGFTATPKFSEKKQVSNLLEKEIHSMTIREAVESGMLCSVSSIIVKTEADMSNVKVKDSGEYDEKELEKAVNIASRNKAAVDLYKKVYDGQLAVAYCVGIDHAAAVAKEFSEAGVSAAHISGKTSKKEQEEILERFHNGEIKVLCNADLLIAGFDEQKASICLNLRPTQSRIDAEQRGGRVLRLDKTKPKKLATVVDFLDKNYSSDKPPVLFADVADGAYFYSDGDEEMSGGGGRGGDGGEVPVIIDVEGVEVIYDSEEVMKIVGKIRDEKEKDDEKEMVIKDLEILKKLVQSVGVANKTEYRKLRQKHKSWHSNPNTLPGWVSWYDFFGKEKPEKRLVITDLSTLKEEVKLAGIKDQRGYWKALANHPTWHSNPNKLIGWANWYDFLGREKPELITDISILKREVQAAGINGQKEYKESLLDHPTWHSSPHTLPGWVNWYDFVGKKMEGGGNRTHKSDSGLIRDIDILKKEVAKKNIRSIFEYNQVLHDNPTWPSAPKKLHGWVNWYDLFGTVRPEGKFTQKVESYAVLKDTVQALGIKNREEYRSLLHTHPDWPFHPNQHFKKEWKGWEDFLGVKKAG